MRLVKNSRPDIPGPRFCTLWEDIHSKPKYTKVQRSSIRAHSLSKLNLSMHTWQVFLNCCSNSPPRWPLCTSLRGSTALLKLSELSSKQVQRWTRWIAISGHLCIRPPVVIHPSWWISWRPRPQWICWTISGGRLCCLLQGVSTKVSLLPCWQLGQILTWAMEHTLELLDRTHPPQWAWVHQHRLLLVRIWKASSWVLNPSLRSNQDSCVLMPAQTSFLAMHSSSTSCLWPVMGSRCWTGRMSSTRI